MTCLGGCFKKKVEESSQHPEASEEGDVLPPINLGGGKILSIQSDGFEITSYFCGCCRTGTKIIMWNTIEQMSVDWHCFSRSITLKLQTPQGPQVYSFRVSRSSSLMHAASSIQKMRETRRRRSSSISAEPKLNERLLRKDLGIHGKVGIMNVGLMVKKRTGCCQSTGLTLPWRSLVTASLSPTWCGREITVTTQVTPDEAYNKSLGEESSSLAENVPEDNDDGIISETKNATLETFIEHMKVTWRGRLDYSEAAFDEVTYMMGAEDGEGAPQIYTKTDTMTMTLGETGIKMQSVAGGKCLCKGNISRLYMPWDSVVSSSWSSPGCFGCCWAPLMTLMDLNGKKVKVKSISEKDYKFFVEKFGERTPQEPGWGGKRPRLDLLLARNEDSAEPRGMLDVQPGGVHIHKRLGIWGKETTFVPWSKVDSARVQTACIGGTADLMTTSGHAIPVATSCSLARRRGLWSICRQMHELKYGVQSPPENDIRVFNESRTPITSVLTKAARSCGCTTWADGARQNGMRSEVNDYNVKLVLEKNLCTRFIREFDLAKIETCRVTVDKVLVLKVQCSGGDLEVIVMTLDESEDGDAIVCDILARRLQKRSKDKIGDPEEFLAVKGTSTVGETLAREPLLAVTTPMPSAPPLSQPPSKSTPSPQKVLLAGSPLKVPPAGSPPPVPPAGSLSEVTSPMPSAPPLSNAPRESSPSPAKAALAGGPPKAPLAGSLSEVISPTPSAPLSLPKSALRGAEISPVFVNSPVDRTPTPPKVPLAASSPKAALASAPQRQLTGSLSEAIEARKAAREQKQKDEVTRADTLLADARTDARLRSLRQNGQSGEETPPAKQLTPAAKRLQNFSNGASLPNPEVEDTK